MANEISINGSLSFATAGLSAGVSKSANVSPEDTAIIEQIVAIDTSDTVIDLGAVAAPGWVMLVNQDPTNFVIVGSDGTLYPIKIGPGQSAGPMLWNEAAVHAKADTAACNLAVLITGR